MARRPAARWWRPMRPAPASASRSFSFAAPKRRSRSIRAPFPPTPRLSASWTRCIPDVSPSDMQIATVVGTVVATKKHPALQGAKLLLVQPETPEGEPRGPVLLSIDSVGAGIGERVLVVIEGKAAGDALGRRGAPVDAAIVGIIDRVDDTLLALSAAPVEAA